MSDIGKGLDDSQLDSKVFIAHKQNQPGVW